jgi:hypothetical protein
MALEELEAVEEELEELEELEVLEELEELEEELVIEAFALDALDALESCFLIISSITVKTTFNELYKSITNNSFLNFSTLLSVLLIK